MSLASAQDQPEPILLAGLPLAKWAFALRIWLSMVIALGLAFWLQLDSASSAAVTVGVLAQPQRGQAFRKAFFFFGATLLGIVASIAITAVFAQTRELFLLVFAAWLAGTVYVAAFYDGARSYGAVLSGYTVAIVAVTQIDSPQDVFNAATNRLGAITVGILTVVFVNDVLASPTLYPTVRARLHTAQDKVRALVFALTRGEAVAADSIVAALGAITGLRLDIQAVAAEGTAGRRRAATAASAATALVTALLRARGFGTLLRSLPEPEAGVLRQWIETEDHAAATAALDTAMADPDRTPERVMPIAAATGLLDQLRLATDDLAAMEEGWPASRRVTLPIHRDREVARLAAVRVFFAVGIAAAVFILSGWPKTSSSLLYVCVLGALSSTMPDPRVFAKGVMIGIPLAAVAAGLTEFGILDGSDAFPILALGLVPAIFLANLVSQHPSTATVGALMTTFTIVILSPANPQNYDAQDYLTSAVLITGGAWLFAGLLYGFFPVTAKDRRRWLMRRAAIDLRDAARGAPHHRPDDTAYLSADRLVALARIKLGAPAAQRWRLRCTLTLSTLTNLVGAAQGQLRDLSGGAVPRGLAESTEAALATLDRAALSEAARALLAIDTAGSAEQRRELATLVADLQLTATIVDAHAADVRHATDFAP